jgi:hypothetical protein
LTIKEAIQILREARDPRAAPGKSTAGLRMSAVAMLQLTPIIAPVVTADEEFSPEANSTGNAAGAPPLSLFEAIVRTLKAHPDLQLFRTREARLQAAAEIAAHKPAIALGLDAENFGGMGAASAADSAEVTLSLASVLERGGKREARQALAASQLDAMSMAREATRSADR